MRHTLNYLGILAGFGFLFAHFSSGMIPSEKTPAFLVHTSVGPLSTNPVRMDPELTNLKQAAEYREPDKLVLSEKPDFSKSGRPADQDHTDLASAEITIAYSGSDISLYENFVETKNGEFKINGKIFRFAGTNAYYLPNYEKLDPRVVDRAFDIFEEAGITVVRMWAFYDGYDCGYSRHDSTENVIQTEPGVYNESALRDLDRVIAKGKQRGIRFILPFINYWNELGGICQYNTWAGAVNPDTNMSFFLNHPDTQRWFRDYIKMLLNRVNTETGIAYKDEPAIFSWQIMNEGRNSDEDPEILRDWYQEMAKYIKSIAPNHLVGTGEEGFDERVSSKYSVNKYSNTYALRAGEGSSYILNTAIPEIDYGNAHWHPTVFGFGYEVNENLIMAQQAWIEDHARIARELDKPFLLGEYSFPAWGDSRMKLLYRDLWDFAEHIELNGSLLWQLTADGTKCYEFGGNICYPGGREDYEIYDFFRSHIHNINN